ncbi:MAG: hypothetical protein HXY34_10000 [Candidatus Thorarchaeota archaeon]|nr:hypothetical protein [Candidatus Thorarchaeota archaeon]
MTTREMVSLWWRERWVRYMVFSLTPIGFVDAIYTVLLWNSKGAEYEINPIVRLALSTEWWYIWFVTDVVSFSLFAMVAGSYYLHTRSRIFGTKTKWLAVLVAFRVAAATHNILLFYSVSYPVFGTALAALVSYLLLKHLLGRTEDISRRGLTDYVRWKYYRLRDHLVSRGLKMTQTEPKEVMVPAVKDSVSSTLKRAGYISAGVLVFVSTPFILALVGDLTGLTSWSEVFGPYVFFNEISGPAFIVGFVVILVLTAAILRLLLEAFGDEGGAW